MIVKAGLDRWLVRQSFKRHKLLSLQSVRMSMLSIPSLSAGFASHRASHEFPVQKKNPASLSRCPWGPSLLPDVGPVKRDAAKIEDPGSSHGKQTSNRREAEQSALPELGAEHTTARHTVIGNGRASRAPNNA